MVDKATDNSPGENLLSLCQDVLIANGVHLPLLVQGPHAEPCAGLLSAATASAFLCVPALLGLESSVSLAAPPPPVLTVFMPPLPYRWLVLGTRN